MLLNATAIYNEQGEYVLSRSTIFDNSARKAAEEALRASRDELRAANLALERASRLKDEFLANMSHELRTPLNSILGFSEGLLEQYHGPLNDRQQASVRNIETSGRHLLALISDILDLSKVEAGRLDLQLQLVSLADVCESSLLFVKESATKKALRLGFHLNDHLALMEADPKRLKQMLVNLLSNAVKFTPSGGEITLEATTDLEAGQVAFTVADTGIGIAPEDLPRLFHPFTQLDSRVNRQHDGTGLGLALVRRLAELHNGGITVQSEIGRGSRFTVTIPYTPPRRKNPSPTFPDEPPTSHPALEITPHPDPVQVLLAENNQSSSQTMRDYLEAKGFRVTIARNGHIALEQARAVPPHLILIDIQMPEMDGLEATRRLRAMPAFATTPIIALTALAMPGDRERCLAAGANDYLSKPIQLSHLVARMQQLLEQTSSGPE